MNRVERLEFHGLKVNTPFGPARIARAVLAGLDATAALDRFTLDELRLEGASVEFELQAHAQAGQPWRFDPAAGTDGTVRAYITDAAWVLDADVTVPIERGRMDFNHATVEHIGPDSSMGLSRIGAYVDAPNGRTYLYEWTAAEVPGARYGQRGALRASTTSDRGALELQPFVEALLAGLTLGAPAAGTRQLLERTRLSGQLRLGDGSVGNGRHGLVLTERDEGSNRVELSSMPSGRGFGVRIAELSAAELRFELAGRAATAATLKATVGLQLKDPAGKPSIDATVAELILRGVAAAPISRRD